MTNALGPLRDLPKGLFMGFHVYSYVNKIYRFTPTTPPLPIYDAFFPRDQMLKAPTSKYGWVLIA